MGIRWGHFSDLHFTFQNFETQMLRDSLICSLEKESITLDYIFITGDISHKNKYDDRTGEFIKQIAQRTNCSLSNVIICPGNHDVERNDVRKLILNSILGNNDKKSGIWELTEAQKTTIITNVFSSFYEKCENITSISKDEHLHYIVKGDQVNIYVLNTAVFSGQTCPGDPPEELQKEDTNLYICDKQLYDLSPLKTSLNCSDSCLNIAIAHHGVECFAEEEQKRLKLYLNNLNIDLLLCGHVHKNVLDRLSNTKYNIPQLSCGGLFTDEYNEPSFIIGEYNPSDSCVKLTNYAYIPNNGRWAISNAVPEPYDNGVFNYTIERLKSLPSTKTSDAPTEEIKKNQEIPFKLVGHTLLAGRGSDGIKYFWEKDNYITESITFNKGSKTDDPTLSRNNISAYTNSVSIGCILNASSSQCKFCETGTLNFNGYLTAEEMALQNIFMAEYDSNCTSYPKVKNNSREFAYMGQGEPGFIYPIIRKSILLTDCAMDLISQRVERYVISTCGISGFIPLLINDINNGVYKNNVSVHFSLNVIGNDRDFLMPINRDYRYSEFLKECIELNKIKNEKIGVGVIIFNNFKLLSEDDRKFKLTEENLKAVLNELNPSIFKIDLCDYNSTSLGEQPQVSNAYANRLLEIVKSKGFEGKLFSSFGIDAHSGCGMLKAEMNECNKPGNTTMTHYNNALDLLNTAKQILGY